MSSDEPLKLFIVPHKQGRHKQERHPLAARHPSMSAADTGERVLKYLLMFLILKCCWMYSCPSSSSHHAPVSVFWGQMSEAGCVALMVMCLGLPVREQGIRRAGGQGAEDI
jgi:hypothetical protein